MFSRLSGKAKKSYIDFMQQKKGGKSALDSCCCKNQKSRHLTNLNIRKELKADWTYDFFYRGNINITDSESIYKNPNLLTFKAVGVKKSVL